MPEPLRPGRRPSRHPRTPRDRDRAGADGRPQGPGHPARQRPAPRAIRVIASGRVEAGTGPGCLLLATDQGRTWLLVGGDRAVLTTGARVRVVGERAAARTAGCQEGEPLRVWDATPAG